MPMASQILSLYNIDRYGMKTVTAFWPNFQEGEIIRCNLTCDSGLKQPIKTIPSRLHLCYDAHRSQCLLAVIFAEKGSTMTHYFSREEAEALLPQISVLLRTIQEERRLLRACEADLDALAVQAMGNGHHLQGRIAR